MATVITSREDLLDELLTFTCEELQLPPSWHEAAEDRYRAVCNWLEEPGSPLRQFRPSLYPQGSFRIGTTVRPIGREEFDLDLVCELDLDCSQYEPTEILNAIERRLRKNATYNPMVERLKRCIRLNYAKQFHLDVLPACPEVPPIGTRVHVPDRKLHRWMPSNPKGYATWFESLPSFYLAMEMRKAEPVPERQSAAEKTALQRTVQLLKRWRDRSYKEDPDRAPRSIVLTTLAGQVYRGNGSTANAFSTIIDGILLMADAAQGPLEVRNPANEEELLSEKWREDPASFRLFVSKLRVLKSQWTQALGANGPALAAILEDLFGEELLRAYKRQAEKISQSREDGTLRTQRGTGILTTTGSQSIAVRGNTFYGDAPATR